MIFVRHGYSTANEQDRFAGHSDFPLATLGHEQARLVAKYITEHEKVDAIYSSDLCRAVDTVKPIANALNKEIHTSEALREVNVGIWQGMLVEDVKIKYPKAFLRYKETPGLTRFEGGEGYDDILARALPAVQKIAAENEGKTVIIGTHGGVIRVLRAAWTGIPLERIDEVAPVANASVTEVDCENGSFHIVQIGYADYLTDKTQAQRTE
jgi:alpha-ribazole phosphatase/probable phosphoglycerate mutase